MCAALLLARSQHAFPFLLSDGMGTYSRVCGVLLLRKLEKGGERRNLGHHQLIMFQRA